jgi:XisH protein
LFEKVRNLPFSDKRVTFVNNQLVTIIKMARDIFHENVREALIKEGWDITSDPLTFKIGKVHVQIDLGAERLIAAQRGTEQIAIEIKTFGGTSFITSLYEAIGKYIIYRNVLEMMETGRTLYLAIPEKIYDTYFLEKVIQKTIKEEKFNLVIYNQTLKTITIWQTN